MLTNITNVLVVHCPAVCDDRMFTWESAPRFEVDIHHCYRPVWCSELHYLMVRSMDCIPRCSAYCGRMERLWTVSSVCCYLRIQVDNRAGVQPGRN